MLNSMTAFACHRITYQAGVAVWEVRSLNHRYLEFNCRLPEALRTLEPAIRQQTTFLLTRGKIECTLRLIEDAVGVAPSLVLNKPLVQQLLAAAQWVKEHSGSGVLNLLDILRWPGALVVETAVTQDEPRLIAAYEEALQQLVAKRQDEGKALQRLLEQRLTALEQLLDSLQHRLPDIVQHQQQKLQEKLRHVSLPLELTPDADRLASALLLWVQRLDVTEELERLALHLQETRAILQQPDAMGRRLDFMMQELSREANTLAAKATLPEVTLAAIEMKLLIEQMREQIQNIE